MLQSSSTAKRVPEGKLQEVPMIFPRLSVEDARQNVELFEKASLLR
jgi:hypothetical protein